MSQRKKPGKINNKDETFVLRLYVTGASPNSLQAIQNVKNLCEEYLAESYDLEIIDVYQTPLVAQKENIIALPLLVKKYPLPERRFIGNISDERKVLEGIGLSVNKKT